MPVFGILTHTHTAQSPLLPAVETKASSRDGSVTVLAVSLRLGSIRRVRYPVYRLLRVFLRSPQYLWIRPRLLDADAEAPMDLLLLPHLMQRKILGRKQGRRLATWTWTESLKAMSS